MESSSPPGAASPSPAPNSNTGLPVAADPKLTDQQKLSFESARAVTLQLITVATALITVGVTFYEKFKPTGGP